MLEAFLNPWLTEVVGGLCKPYRLHLLTVTVAGLLGSTVALAIPWAIGQFAEELVQPELPGLVGISALLIVLVAFELLINYATGWILGTTGHRLLLDFRALLFDKLQRSPLLDVTRRSPGELVNLSENDAYILVNCAIGALTGLLPYLITFFGAVWLMSEIDGTVALIALIATPFFIIVARLVGRGIRPISDRMYARHGESLAQLEENLGLLQLIKSRTGETTELDRYEGSLAAVQAENRARLRLQLLLSPLTRIAGATTIVGAMTVSIAFDARHDVAELVSLLFYGLLTYSPVTGIANVYGSIQSAMASVDRLERVMNRATETPDAGKQLAVSAPPSVSVEDVDFSYQPGHPILRGLSLEIGAGEFVVLTGRNGIGKSTLALLLCRFVDPDAGRILVDDQDVHLARLSDLRRTIGLVYQGMPLLDRSIRENLRYGTDVELDPADIRGTGLLDFVDGLEGGLDYRVGSGGNLLSGGQRQRVALAAVLLQARPILLLDEATSMLDEPCQQRVRRYIASMQDVTRIVVDHDPSAWPGARILTL